MGSKLFFYLFKKKLVYLFVSLLILTVTVQIVDLIELTRSNIGKENFSFERVIKMSLLKTPFLINEIMPFIIIKYKILKINKAMNSPLKSISKPADIDKRKI